MKVHTNKMPMNVFLALSEGLSGIYQNFYIIFVLSILQSYHIPRKLTPYVK